MKMNVIIYGVALGKYLVETREGFLVIPGQRMFESAGYFKERIAAAKRAIARRAAARRAT